MILYFYFFYCLQQTNLSWTCASLKRYSKYTKGIWSKCNHSKALYNPVPPHIVVCQSMRCSPLVLMAFPDGLLFSGNDIWVFTVLTGWDSPQAEWVPEGWLDGAAGRFMRRDGKQTAAMAKTRVLPFGSSKSEARGKSQPSKRTLPIHYIINALFIPDKSELFLKNLDII